MLALCIAAFFAFGIVLVLVGANQAALALTLDLDLEQSGLLGSALALGAGLGISAAGPLFDRYPRKPLFALSAWVVAAALASVHAEMSFVGLFLRVAIAGLGAGAYNTVVNATTSERYGSAAARPLALVHASATLGAMLAPLAFVWLERIDDWTLSFRLAGAVHLLLGGLVWLTPGFAVPVKALRRAPPPYGRLAPYLFIVFGYVAIEGTATIFAVPYAMRHLALDPLRGQQAISGLWLGVLVSRACLLAAGSRLGLRAIAGAGVVSMVVTACAVLSGARTVELVFGAIGLAVGAVYPLTMALIGQRFADTRGTATGIAGGAGALGAVVAPWLTGALGDRVGVGLGVASMALWGLLIVVGALNALAHLRKETRP